MNAYEFIWSNKRLSELPFLIVVEVLIALKEANLLKEEVKFYVYSV